MIIIQAISECSAAIAPTHPTVGNPDVMWYGSTLSVLMVNRTHENEWQ